MANSTRAELGEMIAANFTALSIILCSPPNLKKALASAALEQSKMGRIVAWHLLDTLSQCCGSNTLFASGPPSQCGDFGT
jgi:hypothetical protein